MAELSKERLDIIVALCDGLDGEDMQHLIERLGMDDQMRIQLGVMSEYTMPDKRLTHIGEDVVAVCNYHNQLTGIINKMATHLGNIDEASDDSCDISHWKTSTTE